MGRAVLSLAGTATVVAAALAVAPVAKDPTEGLPLRFEAASVDAPAAPRPATVPVAHVVPAARTGTQIVALGDSVLSARRCGCPGALTEYAHLVDGRTRAPAYLVNAADGPTTSDMVLTQLDDLPTLAADVRSADVVVLMVGANDFDDAFRAVIAGAAPAAAYAAAAEHLRRNVVAIVDRVRALRGDRIPVQILGYWNDFRDGQVAAQQYSAAKRAAAASATAATNAALKAASDAAGAQWVPLLASFTQHGDPTRYLEVDGNHPDAAGNDLIAAALFHAWQKSNN